VSEALTGTDGRYMTLFALLDMSAAALSTVSTTIVLLQRIEKHCGLKGDVIPITDRTHSNQQVIYINGLS